MKSKAIWSYTIGTPYHVNVLHLAAQLEPRWTCQGGEFARWKRISVTRCTLHVVSHFEIVSSLLYPFCTHLTCRRFLLSNLGCRVNGGRRRGGNVWRRLLVYGHLHRRKVVRLFSFSTCSLALKMVLRIMPRALVFSPAAVEYE